MPDNEPTKTSIKQSVANLYEGAKTPIMWFAIGYVTSIIVAWRKRSG